MGVRPNVSQMSALGVLNVRPREDMGVRPCDVIHRTIHVDYVLVCATQTCLFGGFQNTLGFEFADDSPGVPNAGPSL